MSEYGTNSGHGHVWERPDGMKARCGGPALCKQCALDLSTANYVSKAEVRAAIGNEARRSKQPGEPQYDYGFRQGSDAKIRDIRQRLLDEPAA